MGKKINCTSTPRGRKSKDQGGEEIKGRATIYTPAFNRVQSDSFRGCVPWSVGWLFGNAEF